jgi:hypothetical protein
MLKFRVQPQADRAARGKASRDEIVAHHKAMLAAERRDPAPATNPPLSRKKAGFGKRGLHPYS